MTFLTSLIGYLNIMDMIVSLMPKDYLVKSILGVHLILMIRVTANVR